MSSCANCRAAIISDNPHKEDIASCSWGCAKSCNKEFINDVSEA